MSIQTVFIKWNGGWIWIIFATLITTGTALLTVPIGSQTELNTVLAWLLVIGLWYLSIPRKIVYGTPNELIIKRIFSESKIPWNQITRFKLFEADKYSLKRNFRSDGLLIEVYTTDSVNKPFATIVTIAVPKKNRYELMDELEKYRVSYQQQ